MVLEVIYSDLDNDDVSKDPECVLCIQAVWRKVIQSASVSFWQLGSNVLSRYEKTSCEENHLLASRTLMKYLLPLTL